MNKLTRFLAEPGFDPVPSVAPNAGESAAALVWLAVVGVGLLAVAFLGDCL